MQHILPAIPIAAGALLIILGLCYKSLKISVGRGEKSGDRMTLLYVLEHISSGKTLRKSLDFLAHNKLLPNKLAVRILELSEAGISLQQFYLLKIMCLLLSAALVLIIGYSNYSYKTRMIIETSDADKTALFGKIIYDRSKYELFRQISEGVGADDLKKTGEPEKYALVEQAAAESLNITDKQILKEYTEWFLNTIEKVNKLRVLNLYSIIIIFAAFLLPEAALIIRWFIRGSVYKREVIKLEYIFELLARVEGIKTLDIIDELEKSSKIYSKFFHEFSQLFKYDKKRGFDYLRTRNIKSLTKVANVLEVYSLSDKEIALQIMEREVMERDEAIIMTADETVDFIDLVAFLSIAPLVYELARLMLDPMLDMVYKAFEFI